MKALRPSKPDWIGLSFNIIGFLSIFGVAIAALVGYVLNIVKVFQIPDAGSHIGELIIRVIGIFTGIIGAIAGYF